MGRLDFVEIDKDMKADRKLAERFLLGYDHELSEYNKLKAEFLAVPKEISAGRGNLPGKPVEAQAIKSAQYDAEHEEYGWLRAVEVALRTFGERKRIFISIRQEAAHKGDYNENRPGRKAWIVYTQRRYSEEISKRFLNDNGWMSDRTMRTWWAQVIDRIVELHLRISIKNKIL